jgi:hypothetical protein
MFTRWSPLLAAVALGIAGVAAGVVDLDTDADASVTSAKVKVKCTRKPFVGTVERTAEDSPTGQPGAERTTSDFRSALVYDFGTDKNYTVYVGEHRIDPKRLGDTLTAPEGDVLVTMFLRGASGTSLRAGTKLVIGKDPVSVVVDAGGGARAVTSNPAGTVTLLQTSGHRLCFDIDYSDDHQTVDGVVNATIP